MNQTSRTTKSIHNTVVAMAFFVLTLLLQFVSRKVFLDYLGTEILGLNTTLTNLLQFLNLAELGVGAAVGFSLYKPLANESYSVINEIVTFHGMLYRRIATYIFVGGLVIAAFFPFIFKKMDLPLWYAYASFGVLLLSALIGYYVNYRQIVLSSAQMDYKIQLATVPWNLTKLVAQIAAMYYLPCPYESWIILELVFSLISSYSLHRVTRRTFPDLASTSHTFAELKTKYRELLVKIRQLFFHRIGGFVMTQFSSIIIYAYISLTTVALYGNYMLVGTGILRLCNAMFNSMSAGVGNLVAEGDDTHIRSVFRELLSLRFAFVGLILYVLLLCLQSFLSLWIGPEYLFGYSTVVLIVATLFIGLTRNVVDQFTNAYGLFSDIWAPVVEAGLNIGLSVLFGWKYGLNGILFGVFVSQIVIISIWKPYYLFSRAFRLSVWLYWREWIKNLGAIVCAGLAAFYILRTFLTLNPSDGWSSLVLFVFIQSAAFALFALIFLLLFRTGFRLFVYRLTGRQSHH